MIPLELLHLLCCVIGSLAACRLLLQLRNVFDTSDTQCPSKCCSKPAVLGLGRPHSVSWRDTTSQLSQEQNKSPWTLTGRFHLEETEERAVQPTVVVVVATRFSPQYHSLGIDCPTTLKYHGILNKCQTKFSPNAIVITSYNYDNLRHQSLQSNQKWVQAARL